MILYWACRHLLDWALPQESLARGRRSTKAASFPAWRQRAANAWAAGLLGFGIAWWVAGGGVHPFVRTPYFVHQSEFAGTVLPRASITHGWVSRPSRAGNGGMDERDGQEGWESQSQTGIDIEKAMRLLMSSSFLRLLSSSPLCGLPEPRVLCADIVQLLLQSLRCG